MTAASSEGRVQLQGLLLLTQSLQAQVLAWLLNECPVASLLHYSCTLTIAEAMFSPGFAHETCIGEDAERHEQNKHDSLQDMPCQVTNRPPLLHLVTMI